MEQKGVSAKSFQDLTLWQKAHKFVLSVYQLTHEFPREELYGLTQQLRRAAVSIPANIAEGFKKSSKKEKVRFYNISQGSIEECRYYHILANDLDYGRTDNLLVQLDEVSNILTAYKEKIRSSQSS